ncbi:glycosyltransferase family 2 protein [Patescibacteria group bacterium]|nr:glycosyltransferase family 2 protein [Patescibacteria group bacterium]
MKTSIIIPAYNEAENIARTLQSLTNQTYQSRELIVIDNNSTDATNQIAQKYADKVILEKKQGYVYAVCRGAKEATGELITFCDADSVYPRKWLAKAVKYFTQNPQTVAVYGGCYPLERNKIISWLVTISFAKFLIFSKVLGLNNTCGFNFIIKKSAYDQVGGYKTTYQKMSPDVELGRRLKEIGKVKLALLLRIGTSTRRFKPGERFKALRMYARAWWAMVRGKSPDTEYSKYNQETR